MWSALYRVAEERQLGSSSLLALCLVLDCIDDRSQKPPDNQDRLAALVRSLVRPPTSHANDLLESCLYYCSCVGLSMSATEHEAIDHVACEDGGDDHQRHPRHRAFRRLGRPWP